VVATSALPERIRPALLGFGTLADGFQPFQLPGGQQARLQMCSVVMKAVQGRAAKLGQPLQACAGGRPGRWLPARGCLLLLLPAPRAAFQAPGLGPSAPPAAAPRRPLPLPLSPHAPAVKLGDDPGLAKVQLDPRLPGEEAASARRRAADMAAASVSARLDGGALSGLLEEAYRAVAREGLLM
jgi:hypothetical protein